MTANDDVTHDTDVCEYGAKALPVPSLWWSWLKFNSKNFNLSLVQPCSSMFNAFLSPFAFCSLCSPAWFHSLLVIRLAKVAKA